MRELGTETRTEPLTRLEAAKHCGFSAVTFEAWVKRGLLPPSDRNFRGWTCAMLDESLERLTCLGFQPGTSSGKKSAYLPLPHCQCCWRRLCDGRRRQHFYWRHGRTRKRLPASWGSPDFMRALIECERQFALSQSPLKPKGDQSTTASGMQRLAAANDNFNAPTITQR
jgi:hypothetical protein